MKGYRAQGGGVVFDRRNAFVDRPVTVSCGQCAGCRRQRAKQWAIRNMHEAQCHEKNSFITLTYDQQNLPAGESLQPRHFQLFIKRFRKALSGGSPPEAIHKPETLRYYHCGEYGEDTGRPHYHALLFGQDFSEDRQIYTKDKRGYPLWKSKRLDDLWTHGRCIIGELTFESAAYVSRYIMKKITGPSAEEHYHGQIPEYSTMSRRPGIGSTWYKKYGAEIRANDFCIINGAKARPPSFYDVEYQRIYPEEYETTKTQRIRSAQKYQSNNTPERLRVREQVQEAKEKGLTRNLN